MWGIGLAILTGCAVAAPAFPVTESFSCRADVSLEGQAVGGTLTRSAAGTLRWELDTPASLAGWTLSADGEGLTLELGELSYSVEADAMPAAAPVRVLMTALDAVSRRDGETETTAAEDGGRTVGACSAGAFVLVSDNETGALRSLSVPECGLTIRFSAFAASAASDP